MRGFTLLECIVYIGICGLMVQSLYSGFYIIAIATSRSATLTGLEAEGTHLLRLHLSDESAIRKEMSDPRFTLSTSSRIVTVLATSSGSRVDLLFTLNATTSTGARRSASFTRTFYQFP
jgi:Tfp pilus assembly protein PilE